MTRITLKLLLAVAPLGLALGGSALGADMSVGAPLLKAPPYSPYSWTGWYVGVNAGYGIGQNQGNYAFSIPALVTGNETFNAATGGGFGGGQLGYNYQINSVVVGLETDIQGSGISDTRTCMLGCGPVTSATIDQKLTWFGTTRARLGWATGPVLTYVTVGAAYGGTETGVTSTLGGGAAASSMINSTTKSGWTWGTGVEAALGGNWTAKAEYLYVDLGTASASNAIAAVPFTAAFSTKYQEQLFRGGINYRFGPDQSAGIWPTYNWAGLFVGGTFGYGIGRNDSTLAVPAAAGLAEAFFLSPRGFEGGGIVGYNWQFGRWVAGVDADIQGNSGNGYLTCVFTCSTASVMTIDQNLSWFGTVRGRLGYAVGPALFYATAGGAYGAVKESFTQTAGGAATGLAFSHSKSGFAVGGGIENKLDIFGLLGPNWTTRTEYLYVDLGSVSDSFPILNIPGAATQTLTSNLHEHVWRTVVSYKFGGM